MLRVAVIISIVFVSARSNAQELKLAGFEGAGYPQSSLLEFPGTTIDYTEFGAFITIPLVSKDTANILVNEIRYRQLNTGLNNSDLYAADRVEQNYYQISWAFNWIHTFNKKWLLLSSATPTLASDLERTLSWDDFLVQAAVLLRRTSHPHWKYGVGVSYNTGFGRPLFMPIAELSYRKLPWSFSALLPASVMAMYQRPKDNWRVGASVALDGSYFKLGIGDVLPGNTAPITHAQYTRINLGPIIDLRIRGPIRLQISGGIATNRILRFVNADATVADLKATTGPFGKATLAYVIKLQ